MKKLLSIVLAIAMVFGVMNFASANFDVTPQVAIGNSIWDFDTTDLITGENVTGADLFPQATLTVINFWDTGCGPCLAEMPYFQAAHELYEGTGTVQIVGVIKNWFGGTPQSCREYLQNHGYTYQNLIPDTILNNTVTPFGALPTTIFINDEGVIVGEHVGSMSESQLFGMIETYFEQLGGEYPTFDVTFVDGLTDEVIEVQAVELGQDAVLPTAPEHEGYNFGRWEGDYTNVNSDRTITATYVPRTYRVDFYDGVTGERIDRQYVQHGNAAQEPEVPEHAGYSFIGWDADFSNITSNLDVTAQYIQGELNPGSGDINGDGSLSAMDALLALRASLGSIELTEDQMAAADYDGNGTVNALDALAILRASM